MNKVNKITLVLIFAIGLLPASLFIATSALAYDASSTLNITVTGSIEEPACEVTVKPSTTIDLGTVSYQILTGKAGAHGDSTPVKLVFNNCMSGLSSVTLSFSGSSFDETYPSIYKNFQTGSNGATGVGMQLLSQTDQQPLGPGDRYLFTFDNTDTHTFNMIARMYSPYGNIRAGVVGFTATFDVAYK
ncbi:TPA: fimbrial protein [Klebsiella aerogenes]|uniref:fimbrial protein n=1 Tax=Klebsiella aerogenes TaxID=548 RepID=UPI0027F92A6A|nr:fimbrial protein [Klebsiella aerogenes]MEB5697073.1 fimbrial protein [Klebsiella aerogenes]HDT6510120.1 fimbrial protein [Klebsiella aerogenes]